jgi:hypothetical protein
MGSVLPATHSIQIVQPVKERTLVWRVKTRKRLFPMVIANFAALSMSIVCFASRKTHVFSVKIRLMPSINRENAKHVKTFNWKTAFSAPLQTSVCNANQRLTTSKVTNTVTHALRLISTVWLATTSPLAKPASQINISSRKACAKFVGKLLATA